jgi:hypothetical protein
LSHRLAEQPSGRASSTEGKRLVAPEHYQIEAAIGRNPHLSVACELRFHPLREGVRAIKFYLLPDRQVSRLTLDGREIPLVQEGSKRDGSFYVVLPSPWRIAEPTAGAARAGSR